MGPVKKRSDWEMKERREGGEEEEDNKDGGYVRE